MKTAVIYARVSDSKQAEADVSIPAQVDAGHRKAAELGATVLRVYREEGRSAYQGTRPLFEEAVQFACSTGTHYFICWSSSRFARNRLSASLAKGLLDHARVALIYVSMPVDRATDQGWAFDGIMEIWDEMQSRRTSADTTRSMLDLARAGFYCGGRPPMGFASVPAPDNPKRKRLVPVPAEVVTVREMFRLRVAGSGSVEIAQILNARNMLNRGRPWSRSTVLALLRNRSVIGFTVFGRRPKGENRNRPEDEWITVQSHQGIIDQADWDTVQALMDDAADSATGGSPHSQHPFTGILKCELCGATMKIETAKGRTQRYAYYRCAEALLTKKCQGKRLRADLVDEWLINVIFNQLFTPASLREIAEALREKQGAWTSDQAARRKAIVSQITSLNQRQSRLFDLLETHGAETPNLGDLTVRMRANKAAIQQLESDLAALDATPPPHVGTIDAPDRAVDPAIGGEPCRDQGQLLGPRCTAAVQPTAAAGAQEKNLRLTLN